MPELAHNQREADRGAALAFQTFFEGQPRTRGVLLFAPSLEGALRTDEVRWLNATTQQDTVATARGKVVVVTRRGVQVFQTDAAGRIAPAWCGNATAAAIFALGQARQTFVLHGPDGRRCMVKAAVEGGAVRQVWGVGAPVFETRTWRGRPLLLTDVFNRYAVIGGPLPARSKPERVRRALCGGGLTGKLAVLDGEAVEFHVAGGRHGAAPLTGLATLALAARSVGWIRDALAAGLVRYHAPEGERSTPLPPVVAGRSQLWITMPELSVRTAPLVESRAVAA